MKEMYQFLLNMWMMGRADEAYMEIMLKKGFISQEEFEMIIATPKIIY